MANKFLTQKETTGNTWDTSAEVLPILVQRHRSAPACCLTLLKMKMKMLMDVLVCGRGWKQS